MRVIFLDEEGEIIYKEIYEGCSMVSVAVYEDKIQHSQVINKNSSISVSHKTDNMEIYEFYRYDEHYDKVYIASTSLREAWYLFKTLHVKLNVYSEIQINPHYENSMEYIESIKQHLVRLLAEELFKTGKVTFNKVHKGYRGATLKASI